ncbi:MAG: hypothetical protein H8D67_14605 [Deltaproteobacteria bacterium]|nr:hypothetical protein [Deltaproteobacteria bacterium]
MKAKSNMPVMVRFLTEKEEAELHFEDYKAGRNTFEGCIRDIRQHTPEWLDTEKVEEEFRKLAREKGVS